MLVRSQDNKALISIENVSIKTVYEVDREDKGIPKLKGIKGWSIRELSCNHIDLGFYDSEEKAITALDDLVKYINSNDKNTLKVFTMPKN